MLTRLLRCWKPNKTEELRRQTDNLKMLCRRCSTTFVDGMILFVQRYEAGPWPDLLIPFENLNLSHILQLLASQSNQILSKTETHMSLRKRSLLSMRTVKLAQQSRGMDGLRTRLRS